MKIVIAPDKFKGALGAPEVAAALANGVLRVFPDAQVRLLPVADGGEGTVHALVTATQGRLVPVTVTGPLGIPVLAVYGILGDGRTAVIEMASASGLALVPDAERNPLYTTTYGTGELMLHALRAGCTELLIGIGGSATCDGGAGMAQALGFRLLDAAGQPISRGGAGLLDLARIDTAQVDPLVRRARIRVACDVDNPLTGPRGAAAVFGPQKGATEQMVHQLDAALARFAAVMQRDLGQDVAAVPGAGAAGGMGAGLLGLLGATLERGVDLVLDAVGFDAAVRGASLVLTGEGCIDEQTAMGKVVAGVLRRAKRAGAPVVAFGGMVTPGADELYQRGLAALVPIAPGPLTLAESMAHTATLLERAAERAMRLIALRV
jgi:glycerate kinase